MSERGLLFFRLDGRRHAVEVSAVGHISSEVGADWTRASILGRSPKGERGLIAAEGESRRALAVDEILGVERVPATEVFALPPLVRDTIGTEGIAGFVARDEDLLFLVDLPHLLRESQESPPHAEND